MLSFALSLLAAMTWEFVRYYWRNAVEIIILWILIYQTYRLFRATRGARILIGLLMILIATIMLVNYFKFQVISWIVARVWLVYVFSIPVILQPEIRTALAKIGGNRWLARMFRTDRGEILFLDNLAGAAIQLSKKHIGALFAIERKISLNSFADTGTKISAEFSPELAGSIFFPNSPLHDGAVILAGNRLHAAGCILPISSKQLKDRSMGLRHRAAIGLTEDTDAICLVVSEETGALSICSNGVIEHDLSPDEFTKRLHNILIRQENDHEESIQKQLDSENNLVAGGDRSLDTDSK